MIHLEVRLGGAREAFAGPLDLLLALARRGGYPLDQLPVARLTGEFLGCLEELRRELYAGEAAAAGELAETLAEFADIASWLVLLKSRSLLPDAPAGEGTPTPEEELGRALLGRGALADAARLLRARIEGAGLPAARPEASDPALPAAGPLLAEAPPPAAAPTIADVVRSARGALDALRARPQPDPYPLEAELHHLQTRLAALPPGEAASTAPWFQARPPAAQAALLLALLELARAGQVLLHQARECGPIALKRVGD